MKLKIFNRLWEKFLTMFGNIKVFKFPMFLVYDPSDYEVKGDDILNIMEVIEPGDVLLRQYNNYLDGKFIPGQYSHGAIYIGNNEVVHAVAPTVEKINIVDFAQCDKIAVLRPRKHQKSAIAKAKKFLANKTSYDFMFERGSTAVYCFELVKECYPKLDIKLHDVKTMKVFKKKDVVIAKSLLDSPDFTVIYEAPSK